MTCIVGLVHDGAVWIGGDSAASDGDVIEHEAAPKVFVIGDGDFLVGGSGSFRAMQILRHGFEPPARHPRVDVWPYMVTLFVEHMRHAFTQGGQMCEKDGVEAFEADFLIGYAGRLFHLQGDLAVLESAAGYNAAGSGAAYALGALYATDKRKAPRARVLAGLQAAASLDPYVREPFVIERLG